MDKQISKEQQKKIQLDVLKNIDEFCKENNIKYSLAFGTLLGAVRHQGYIPWDDDIDIMMTRDNYERFRSLYNSNRYPLIDLKSDKSHPVSMGKVYDSETYFYYRGNIKRKYGLFVDVFPFDVVPEQLDIRENWLKLIKRYAFFNQYKNNTFSFCLKQKNIYRIILGCFVKIFFSSAHIHNQLEELYSKFKNVESAYYGVPAVMVMKKSYSNKLFPKYLFDEYITLGFEGVKYPCISRYDEFLRIFYGNYLELPPKEKRIGKHGIKAFFK